MPPSGPGLPPTLSAFRLRRLQLSGSAACSFPASSLAEACRNRFSAKGFFPACRRRRASSGRSNYWKSHDFDALSDGAIDTVLAAASELPTPECEIFIGHLGGAMGRVAPDATPFPSRNAHFVMNVHTRWRDSKDDAACIEWARTVFAATEPHATGRAYVNFMPADEAERVEKLYGANYRRLVELKLRYDPDNLFRANQNIAPSRRVASRAAP